MTISTGTSDTETTSVIAQVRALTGFDAAHIDPRASDIVIAGVPGVGIGDLIEVCRLIDPTLRLIHESAAPTGGLAVHAAVGLMVVDPSSSVGAEEVELMASLRRRVGTVALVCTKIDAFWEWPRILRTHRRTLDPFEELPVFAVSAAAGLAGALDESGIAEVVAWLTAAVSAPRLVRTERSRIGACQGALVEAIRLDDARLSRTSASDPGRGADQPDSPADMLRRRRALISDRDRGRSDRLAALRAGLSGVRAQSLADVQAGIRALVTSGTQRCAQLHGGDRDVYADWLDAGIAELTERVDEATSARFDEVSATALLGLDTTDTTDTSPDAAPELPPLPSPRRPIPTGRRGAEDALLVLVGASTGLGIGRLVVAPMASVQTLQWISMPLTLALGVAVATWVIHVRRASTSRAQVRAWTLDGLAEARGRLEHRVASRIAAAESRMSGQVGRHYERRLRQVTAEVAELDERMRRSRDRDGRAPAAGRSESQRAEAAALRERLAHRAQELWSAPLREKGEHRDGSVPVR